MAPTPKKPVKNFKGTYCMLCRKFYATNDVQQHMHSMLHHRELETVLGTNSRHDCYACQTSCVGLNEYAYHITTALHKAQFKVFLSKNIMMPSLEKTLHADAIAIIMERNKALKRKEKKAKNKQRKKLKQLAAQKSVMLKEPTKKTTVPPENNLQKSKQADVRNIKQQGAVRNQSGTMGCLSVKPKGKMQQLLRQQEQLSRSAHRLQQDAKVSAKGVKSKKESGAEKAKNVTWPPADCHYYHEAQYSSEKDDEFISDHLPLAGAIIFEDSYGTHKESCQTKPEQSSECPTIPASPPQSVNRSSSSTPARDVDISAMLRQIRRALGVREPCRADRQARLQSSKAGVQVSGTESARPEGASEGNSAVKAPLQKTSNAAADQSATTLSVQAQQSNTVSSLASTSQCKSKTTSTKPKVDITQRMQKVTKSSKPTLRKLLTLSGSRRNLNPKEVYEDIKRKNREMLKGIPRFGIELAPPLSDQGCALPLQDNEQPPPECLNWESLPDSPPHLFCPLTPLNQQEEGRDALTDAQSSSANQEVSELPAAAPKDCSITQTVTQPTMKTEPISIDENGHFLENGSTKKRRSHTVKDGDINNKDPSGKRRRKTKSNEDQVEMNQLLAVSLKEEDLNHSLLELDKCLIQARSALQTAYAEVQRLLLLRQQVIAEVNDLRSKRIEILQGMQENYSGASDVENKAIIPSTGAAATVQATSLSSLPSEDPGSNFSDHTLVTVQSRPSSCSSSSSLPFSEPASSISHHQQAAVQSRPSCSSSPALPSSDVASGNTHHHPASTSLSAMTLKFKKDISESLAQKQEIKNDQTVSCNADACQMPVNSCVPVYVLDTPTTSPHSPAPITGGPPRQVQENLSNIQVKGREVSVDKPVSRFVPGSDQNAGISSVSINDGGNDCDVEIVAPSQLPIINVEEVDNKESSEKSDSVEVRSATDRKSQPPAVTVKDENVCQESIVVTEDVEPFLGVFENHKGPVYGLQIHEDLLYTCSGDNTVRAYNLVSGERQAVFEGHTDKVNCLLVSWLPNMPARLYTGSSDQTVRCYSTKSKKCLEQISLPDRVFCLHSAWNILYVGLANGSVASFDLKTLKQLDMFECHGLRGVSCLGSAQEGARRLLLVGSYDSTISVRDAKSSLLLRSMEGHSKTVLCMKVVNDLVFSGSSDTSVHAHNIHTGELLRIYKGHSNSVTSVMVLGNVLATACLDKMVRIYELETHDRLQVYGGHSDMVMCMTIHKSVIYTGCYDGSIQAVKLNLTKNYRCLWHGCSLIFGVAAHVVQHLVGDHTNPSLHTIKCRWRDCSTFFGSQLSVRQELPDHMQSHVENESEIQP
ncbi:zinc finger protein 106 [Thalassophryne amazonica]|uniref:zinc finger protein 106 n=1 Tax=Thalassophryne amazonica TaxID=390379 RepID=UPI001470D527|nr:zinc finger protein 106 [Thalassophryne amazonica]